MKLRSAAPARLAPVLTTLMTLMTTVAALAGCKGRDKGKGAPAGDGSATSGSAQVSTPTAFEKLTVTFAGKPLAVQRAFVKRMDPDRYQLYLSNNGGSCEELLGNMFNSRDRVDVLANISPRLNVDGKQYLEVTDIFEGAPTMVIAPGGKVSITGDAGKGEPVEVTLELTAKAQQDPKLTIEAHGSFTAVGCGATARDSAGVPRADHPTTATVTLAGQRLELKGAIVRGSGKERDLLLSTAPKDCSPSIPWATVILERVSGLWRVRGTWLAEEARVTQSPDEKTKLVRAKLGAAGSSEDGPTVQVALSGAGHIEGWPIALDGTIEAIDCKD